MRKMFLKAGGKTQDILGEFGCQKGWRPPGTGLVRVNVPTILPWSRRAAFYIKRTQAKTPAGIRRRF